MIDLDERARVLSALEHDRRSGVWVIEVTGEDNAFIGAGFERDVGEVAREGLVAGVAPALVGVTPTRAE